MICGRLLLVKKKIICYLDQRLLEKAAKQNSEDPNDLSFVRVGLEHQKFGSFFFTLSYLAPKFEDVRQKCHNLRQYTNLDIGFLPDRVRLGPQDDHRGRHRCEALY